jgi:phosphohistidine swiveling domain-containing protein
MTKVDGLGQGNVCSTGNFNITAARALQATRDESKDVAIIPAYVDDVTAVVELASALKLYDDTLTAQKAGTGCDMNVGKVKAILPTATNAAERTLLASVRAGLLTRGVSSSLGLRLCSLHALLLEPKHAEERQTSSAAGLVRGKQ